LIADQFSLSANIADTEAIVTLGDGLAKSAREREWVGGGCLNDERSGRDGTREAAFVNEVKGSVSYR
jgi:hypothetical protein